jgi:hypothetical protein
LIRKKVKTENQAHRKPKICRTGVEENVKFLRRGSDGDVSEIACD